MQRRLRPFLMIASLAPLAGCAGFGDFAVHTADPLHRPYKVAETSENITLAYGKAAPAVKLSPEADQPWPTSYPEDPTIVEIEKSDKGVQ